MNNYNFLNNENYPAATDASNFTIDGTTLKKYIGSGLEEVVVPEGITIIEFSAFTDDTTLRKVVLPKSCEQIMTPSFVNCPNLTKLEINSGLTNFGRVCLENCGQIEYNVLDGVKYLGSESNPYYNLVGTERKDMTFLNLPEGLETISMFGLSDCHSLNEVVLPDSLKRINGCAFEHCDALTTALLPDNIDYIDPSAFNFCDNFRGQVNDISFYYSSKSNPFFALAKVRDDINNIQLHPDAEYILGNAFKDKTNLVNVIMGDKVRYIGDNAFSGCTSLQYVRLSENLQKVGTFLFDKCPNLVDMLVPGSLKETTLAMFARCDNLRAVVFKDGLEFVQHNTFYNCPALGEVDFGTTVKHIESGAFKDCIALTNIFIPQSVETMGEQVFDNAGPIVYVENASDPFNWDPEWKKDLLTVFYGSSKDDVPTPTVRTEPVMGNVKQNKGSNKNNNNNNNNNNANPADKGSFGFFLLSFLIPIVGIILFAVWHKKTPKKSRSCLLGAIIGFVVTFLFQQQISDFIRDFLTKITSI